MSKWVKRLLAGDVIARRPNIRFSTLEDETTLWLFLGILEFVIERVRSS